MQTKPVTVSPALKALLERFIDYAGIYPPACVSLDGALDNYRQYQKSQFSWMLRWLVVGAAELERVPASLDGSLSVLAVADEARAASIETKSCVAAQRPAYCEVAVDKLHELEDVKKAGCYAKIRAGGVKPEMIPSPAEVAGFIARCADLCLPFKATAGLHHPVRSVQPLTYESDAARSMMHGFLNVLVASALAWHGERNLEPIIAETDPSAFAFDERGRWRERSLDIGQIRSARQEFIHSVGSCSFEEPVHDLQALGFLPPGE